MKIISPQFSSDNIEYIKEYPFNIRYIEHPTIEEGFNSSKAEWIFFKIYRKSEFRNMYGSDKTNKFIASICKRANT